MTGICPNCGYNLANDEVIERDGFRLDPRGGVMFHGGIPIYGLIAAEMCVLFSLLKAEGRVLPYDALIGRCLGETGSQNTLHVLVSRIRSVLKSAKLPQPIQTFSSRSGGASGYFWQVNPAMAHTTS